MDTSVCVTTMSLLEGRLEKVFVCKVLTFAVRNHVGLSSWYKHFCRLYLIGNMDPRWTLFVLTLGIFCGTSRVQAGAGEKINNPTNPITGSDHSIQVTLHVKRGPIGAEKGELTTADAVEVSAGELWEEDTGGSNPKLVPKPRWWDFWGVKPNEEKISGENPENCELNIAFYYGEKVAFECSEEATWLVVVNEMEDEVTAAILDDLYPTEVGTADKNENVWDSINKLKPFWMSAKEDITKVDYIAQSDPFEVKSTTDCYHWRYMLKEVSRIGYIFRESGPSGGTVTGEAFIIMDLHLWIAELNAVTESEKNPAAAPEHLDISYYSTFLTRRFNSRGMAPCLRKVHPSVELLSDAEFREGTDSPDFPSPHWIMKLKIHTNTLISTFSDVSFTISSRQHIASFHCSIGNTKAYIGVRDFDFIEEGQSDRYEIRWNISVVPKTVMDYFTLKVEHIYGHPAIFVGEAMKSLYQPGANRTDMLVINNPCITQEFAVAAAGRIVIIEELMEDFHKNAIGIVLPGFGSQDASVKDEDAMRRHGAFFKISDLTFTPTHVVILMEDSTIFLHSPSAFSNGIAYVPSTKKNRFDAFVKRRWCARTGTPKMSNMMVPAYSKQGNIVILQIFPVEGSAKMWLAEPPNTCATPNPDYFESSFHDVTGEVNETCIHRAYVPERSDERGLKIKPDFSDDLCKDYAPPSDVQEDPDAREKYLMNEGEILSESDPHFPDQLRNMAVYKIDDTSNETVHYNKVLTFHLDEGEVGDKNLEKTLRHNGLTTTKPITLHSVEFTAVEKKFLAGVEFEADEFKKGSDQERYHFTMMICTITVTNMPSRIYPLAIDKEETLHSVINFPGVIVVRSLPLILKNIAEGGAAPYIVKLYPINTAIPAFVVDLGNVFVFSSVDTSYARPLTFFKREDIHKIIYERRKTDLKNVDLILKDAQRLSVFGKPTATPCTTPACEDPEEPGTQQFDIVVTEQAVVSILSRRPIPHDDPSQPPPPSPPAPLSPKHSVFVGSLMTLDSLREIRPFTKYDNIFQMATPDGDIVYGKFKTRPFSIYPECDPDMVEEIKAGQDITDTCLVPHEDSTKPPYCSANTENECTEWEFVDGIRSGDLNEPKQFIGFCDKPIVATGGCIQKGKGQNGHPPENLPNKDIDSAKILYTPFFGLLNGNLQLVSEEKITASGTKIDDSKAEERLCPFVNFDVKYLNFNFAEIGFKVRMTAQISYLGNNVPSEAELIVEYENLPGIQVSITSSMLEEKDQTTLTKTVDISITLSDIELDKMKKTKIHAAYRDSVNLAREVADEFSITFRPSIVNLRCNKDDFFITVHYLIGCNPLNKMRFLAEVAPVVRITDPIHGLYKEGDVDIDPKKHWHREGDFLTVPRRDVWHKQRTLFNCSSDEQRCKIPYAYLFEKEIFDISWRDPFVPKFEQFLRSHSRLVTANVIAYDLLGFSLAMNITSLKAGCYHTAGLWYDNILSTTQFIGVDTVEQEDIYHYFVDCFDDTQGRDKPLVLSSSTFRLINQTNKNRIRFDIQRPDFRTKNRHQFLLLRAVVINTDYNRFTYCKLMDTFFLLRIVGVPVPKQKFHHLAYTIIVLCILIVIGIAYIIFAYCFLWKLDVANLDTTDDPENDDPDLDPDEFEEKRIQKELQEQHRLNAAEIKLQVFEKFRQFKAKDAKRTKS